MNEAKNGKTTSSGSGDVEVLQTFAEATTQRYWYRICEKEWEKGTFYSLERGDIVRLVDGAGEGKGRPTKMFTLPNDEELIKTLIEGMQKMPVKKRSKK